jgi:hypothetical protein
LGTHRYGKYYFEAVQLLVNTSRRARLQSKREQDAVADSLNLNVVEAAAQKTPGC